MLAAVKKFFAMDTAPGILLFSAAVLAVIIENAGFSNFYENFKHIPVMIQFGGFKIDKDLCVN